MQRKKTELTTTTDGRNKPSETHQYSFMHEVRSSDKTNSRMRNVDGFSFDVDSGIKQNCVNIRHRNRQFKHNTQQKEFPSMSMRTACSINSENIYTYRQCINLFSRRAKSSKYWPAVESSNIVDLLATLSSSAPLGSAVPLRVPAQ